MQMGFTWEGFRRVLVLLVAGFFSTVVTNGRAPTTEPPSGKPTLYADAVSPTMVSVKWTDIEGETQYRIERIVGYQWVEIGALGGNSANFYDTNLQARTLYRYRVRGWNPNGYSEYSNEAAATTWASASAPGVPRISGAESIALSRDLSGVAIQVYWETVSGATGYKLESKAGATGTWTQFGDVVAVTSNFGQSFIHTNLAVSTDYFYRIRAYNEGGISAYCQEYQTRSMNPPTAAPELEGIATSYNELQLHWNDLLCNCQSPGYIGYRLEVPNGAGWTNLAYLGDQVTNFVVRGLEPATEYLFRLRSENPLASDWSYVTVRTQDAPPVVPQAPTLYAEKESGHSIRVKWLDVELETEYRIERKNAAGEWEQIATVPANTLFYIDAGLEPSTTYVYRIRAANSFGASDYSNQSAGTTGPPPEIPILYGVRAKSQTEIEMYWRAAEGATLYRVERKSGDGAGGWQNIHETTTAPSFPGYADTGLTEFNYYGYRVGALNTNGTWYYSGELGARPHNPGYEQIQTVAATAISSSAIKLSWAAVPFAGGYMVAKLVNGQWVMLTQYPQGTSYTDTGLLPGTTYTYLVYAYWGATSETPATITATTLPAGGEAVSVQSISLTADGVSFRVVSGGGRSFKVQSSSSFDNWTDETEVLTSNGEMQVNVPRRAEAQRVFYRTVSVGP